MLAEVVPLVPRTGARMLLIPEGVRHGPVDRVTAGRSPLSRYSRAAVPAAGCAWGPGGCVCPPSTSLPSGTNRPIPPQAA